MGLKENGSSGSGGTKRFQRGLKRAEGGSGLLNLGWQEGWTKR